MRVGRLNPRSGVAHNTSHLLVVMEKFSKSQLAKILLLLLLLLTPFISTSLRLPYLYFLFNILIVALGVEAGFLDVAQGPRDEKKATLVITSVAVQALPRNGSSSGGNVATLQEGRVQPVKPVEKTKVEKVVAAAKKAQKVKRCLSRPSLFLIGGFDGEGRIREEDEEEQEEEEGEVVVGELSKQELFAKAETFIGNFYKQLKMEEDSWAPPPQV